MNSFVKSTGTVLSAAVLVSTVAACARDLDHPVAARPTPRAGQTTPGPSTQPTSATPTPVRTTTPSVAPASGDAPSTPAVTPPSTPSPSTPTPMPTLVMSQGSTGDQVRELQHRLRQLNWYAGRITDKYGPDTVEAVTGFQRKRQVPATGAVDIVTWQKLVSMTRRPTQDEMNNVLVAGPALYRQGSTGDPVRRIQARLKQLDWFAPTIDGIYAGSTAEAVKGFQGKREIPVTGEIDQRTLDLLVSMTRTPTAEELANKPPAAPVTSPTPPRLDQRCMTGRVLCISKDSRRLYWVIDGKVVDDYSVRFGSVQTPTREGAFSVYWKSRDHHSTLYDSPMPFAMFFDGGQAVHYSADFAARGYAGASHGCVNVRDHTGIKWLFDQVRTGDTVIVYR